MSSWIATTLFKDVYPHLPIATTIYNNIWLKVHDFHT